MNKPSFQDQMPDNYCWSRGSLNEHGLGIKSYWSGNESVCTWQLAAQFMASPQHILNGGIIASLIDCHCICMAVAAPIKKRAVPSVHRRGSGTLRPHYKSASEGPRPSMIL